MKRRFTILTAALALLAILAIPMGMKGQSTVTFDAATDITENAASYQTTELTISAADGSTWIANGYGATANTSIVIGKGGANYLKTPAVEGTITSVAVTWSGNANYFLALQTTTGTELEAKNNPSTSTTETFTVSGSYNQLQLVGRRSSGTSNAAATITKVVVTYTSGSVPQPDTYTVSFDAGEGTFVGNDDFPQTSNEVEAGTYSLPNATREGYTLLWSDGEDTYEAGDDYEVIEDVAFTAQWTENTAPTPTDIVTYDFSTTNNFLTSYPGNTHPGTGNTNNLGTFYYTNGDAFTASGTNRYFNSGYFMLGKSGATLQLPSFDFDVEKIVITGKSGASGAVVQNIYVGDQAVSTATTGATGENTYYIASNYQSAGTYTLKVTSAHNTQITKIEVYRKSDASVSIPTFTPTAGTYVEAQTVRIECQTEDASIVYKLTENGEWVAYSEPITISETTTVWAKATKNGLEDSEVVSATYTIVSIEHDGTETDPYTVADALNSINANTGVNNVYATGIVSAIPYSYTEANGITFNMVDNSGDSDFLQAYKCQGTEAPNVVEGAVVVVYGNLIKYGNKYEFNEGCVVVSLTLPSYPIINVEQESITLAHDATSGAIAYNIQNVENGIASAVSSESWLTIGTITSTSVALSCAANNGDADRTATVTLSYSGAESVEVIVTQGHYMVPGNWVLTSLADLTANDVFVIVGTDGDTEKSYAMTNDRGASNAPLAVEVNVVEGTLSGEIDDNIKWNISGNATEGYTFLPNGDATKWLYNIASNAKCAVGTNENKTYVYDATLGYLQHVSTEKYIGIYFGSTPDWRGYPLSEGSIHSNIANQTFAFYKQVSTESSILSIVGYENDNNAGGYYLIASPVTVNLTNHDHDMTTGDFDLYYFDQAQDDEWRNYKQNAFNLEPGKGYLYAHKTGGNFTLTGTAYDGEGEIELVYDDNAIDFKGWNLVGNPWGVKAYPDHAFYTMAEGGAGIDVTVCDAGTEVAAMTGIFVVAEGENETVTFSKTATGKSANLALNITNSSKLVDRAIVRFGEGRQLPKFQLRDNSTKIYFEQSNKDYAIVNAEEIGEMPVSFKAENNGTYTFSVNTENVELDYLHLIDNMTGADIDLIANPSYSFEAKVTDYASRFRLVFSANSSINEQNANNFAFFNGNDWTINNEGEATLQVVDMTGRVLSTETVNGNATTKVNAATGVYMLRLINGNNIKTQKVVVK